MRFRNSSDYFGLESNHPRRIEPNSATGTAFGARADGISGTHTTLMPCGGLLDRSQQCSRHVFQGHQSRYGFRLHCTARTDRVETAALRQAQGRLSAVQAWAKPRVPTAAAVPASPACDTNARWNRLLQSRLVITSSAPSAAGAWLPW